MATIRDIIERAYRKIGVVAADEPMTADQAANGLSAYNMFMHGLALRGADALHTDQGLADTFALPAGLMEPVVYVLADRLAPDNMVAAPDARGAMDVIQAYFLQVPTAKMPDILLSRRRSEWWTS